jgi:hypothetical protein
MIMSLEDQQLHTALNNSLTHLLNQTAYDSKACTKVFIVYQNILIICYLFVLVQLFQTKDSSLVSEFLVYILRNLARLLELVS